MTGTNYRELSDTLLANIENLCDENDLDYERSGNVLTINLDNETVVINKQEPLEEIWLASRLEGLHFKYDIQAQKWISTRSATEFYNALQSVFQNINFELSLS